METGDAAPARLTHELCAYLAGLKFDDLPAAVVHEARRGVLDWMGCAQAGSSHPTVQRIIDLLQDIGGRPQATVFGRNLKLGVLDAPLVNGQMAHVLDYDDTYMDGTVLHTSSPILPALFALAETNMVNGRQFIVAYVAGFEMAARVAHAAPGHHDKGWHPTGTLGTIAAGVAAGVLLGLNTQALTYATGIAATQSAGLQQNRGTMCKSFHAGRAASNGVLSALLAARGFDSATDILDGKQGFCRIYGMESKPGALTDMLGRRWAIEVNGHKPYSCAIGLHPVIDAMIKIRATGDIEPANITRVELRAHPYLSKYRLLDNPVNGLQAKFSAYHSAAVALIDGAAGVVQYTDARVSDPAVAALRRKIHLTLDDSLGMDQAYARIVAGTVDYEARIDHSMGSVQNPMTDAAIQAKFDANATLGLGASRARRVSESIWNLEALTDVRDLVALGA